MLECRTRLIGFRVTLTCGKVAAAPTLLLLRLVLLRLELVSILQALSIRLEMVVNGMRRMAVRFGVICAVNQVSVLPMRNAVYRRRHLDPSCTSDSSSRDASP